MTKLTIQDLVTASAIWDCDMLARQVAFEKYQGRPVYDSQALAVNVGMMIYEGAMEEYARIYGREWEPVPALNE